MAVTQVVADQQNQKQQVQQQQQQVQDIAPINNPLVQQHVPVA